MHTHSTIPRRTVLSDLHAAIDRLAAALDDDEPIAGALRRFALRLPEADVVRDRRAPPMRDLLYSALDEGTIDAHGFDWLMLAENRAARSAGSSGSPAAPVARHGR